MKYNQKQLQILQITEGENIVNAPAGCGKTEMLTARVKKALAEGVSPKEMICLTFTNRAAAEMKARLEADFSDKKRELEDLFVGNFHRFCSGFLRANNLISSNATLLDEVEYKSILDGILNKNKLSNKIVRGDLYKFLSDEKRKKLGLNPLFSKKLESININTQPDYVTVFSQYEAVKKSFEFVDFDDLLNLTTHYLKDNKQYDKAAFKWLQIDEVQDLNKSQWEIVNLLSEHAICKVYFGDYEQSIFSFMGSARSEFVKFFEEMPSANKFQLDENYRSNKEVINLLNAYLEKTMKSSAKFEGDKADIQNKFRLVEVEGTVKEEIEQVLTLTKEITKKDETLAILFRTNANAQKCSEALSEIGLDHLKVSGLDFFQRALIKDLFAYLSCLVNDLDILSWTRILKKFVTKLNLDDARRVIYAASKSGYLPSDLVIDDFSNLQKFESFYQTKRVVVFDTETTGLNPTTSDIIQIAATEVIDGKVKAKFDVYMQSDNAGNTFEIHKISEKVLKEKGVSQQEGLKRFLEFVGEDTCLCAHNLAFDMAMLTAALKKHTEIVLPKDLVYTDSLILAKLIYPKLSRYKLEFLLESLKLEGVNSHNAIQDVEATVNLVKRLYKDLDKVTEAKQNFEAKYGESVAKFKKNFGEIYNNAVADLKQEGKLVNLIESFVQNSKNAEALEDPRFLAFLEIVNKRESVEDLKGSTLYEKLKSLIQDLSTLSEVDLVNENTKIVIATPYKAKGLGFDNVIICECNEGVYPGYYSKTEDAIAEDKRVMYVALSRAKKNIICTYHTKLQTNYGNTYSRKLSAFIKPIAYLFKD